MKRILLIVLAISATLAVVCSAASDRPSTTLDDDNSLDNRVFSYEVSPKKKTDVQFASETFKVGKIKPNAFANLERESSAGARQQVEEASPRPVLAAAGKAGPAAKEHTLQDEVKAISESNVEMRLVGPDRKPVEMKDDAITKLSVAFENLQQEAQYVWGELSTQLDKGWTDLKQMVEGAMVPANKKRANGN